MKPLTRGGQGHPAPTGGDGLLGALMLAGWVVALGWVAWRWVGGAR